MTNYIENMISISEAMPRDKPVRRYGFELESPSVAENAEDFQSAGMATTHDGSVETPDCVCGCDDCNHSCSCPNCDIYNGYSNPDHCGPCEHNEAQTDIVYEHAPIRLWNTLEGAHQNGWSTPDFDDSDNWGMHVHIEARDLTFQQLLTVCKLGAKASQLMPDLFARDYNRFAEPLTAERLRHVSEGNFEKYYEVNIAHVMSYKGSATYRGYTEEQSNAYEIGSEPPHRQSGKSTVEFRLFNTTADPKLIFARVALCRAIVETAKMSGLYWALSADTPEKFLQAVGFGQH